MAELPTLPPDARPGDVFPPDNKVLAQLGFNGMRRIEIVRFARPFIESGVIDRFPEDLPKTKMVSLMDAYMGQGKFGHDPFGLRGPADEIADLKKRLANMEKMVAGIGAAEKPAAPEGDKLVRPFAHLSDPTIPAPDPDDPLNPDPPKKPEKVGAADMHYRDLQARARELGIDPWRKKKAVLIAEVEAAEEADAK